MTLPDLRSRGVSCALVGTVATVLATVWLMAAPAGAQVSFSSTDYSVGDTPVSVVVGQFNGDSHLDLAIAENGSFLYSGDVFLLFGNGDGTFGNENVFSADDGPTSVAAADFNGDTHPDLAVANGSSNDVSVLLGAGDGTFTPAKPKNIGVGRSPAAVVAGFFNADAHPDLAVANEGSDNVSVLLGKGDGTFSGPTDFSVGSEPFSVVVGDFNGDTNLDLVTANSDSDNASVLLGNGQGSFGGRRDHGTGPDPVSVAVGDFDGDTVSGGPSPSRVSSRTPSRCCWARVARISARPPTSRPASSPNRWRSASSTSTPKPTWRWPTPRPESRCSSAPETAPSAARATFRPTSQHR
jgi:hypothetical protein